MKTPRSVVVSLPFCHPLDRTIRSCHPPLDGIEWWHLFSSMAFIQHFNRHSLSAVMLSAHQSHIVYIYTTMTNLHSASFRLFQTPAPGQASVCFEQPYASVLQVVLSLFSMWGISGSFWVPFTYYYYSPKCVVMSDSLMFGYNTFFMCFIAILVLPLTCSKNSMLPSCSPVMHNVQHRASM